MTEPHFTGCYEWLRALDLILAAPRAEAELRRRGLDIDTVLAVAHIEAQEADAHGHSAVPHQRLAELTGLPRNTIASARLMLVDAGLESLAANPSQADSVYRILQTR